MSEKSEPTVNIVVNARGVKVVQFCGSGWEDESEASRIYGKISHLVKEIDRTVKRPTPAPHDTVM